MSAQGGILPLIVSYNIAIIQRYLIRGGQAQLLYHLWVWTFLFHYRSNFQVMFGECNGATSVINLLAMASIRLANMSSQRESTMQARGKSLNQPLYRRMIWGT